ncbi:MAG: hypothetical protein H6757_02540 [Candidatus Omnitrophica bacterium]|nr:hypothetical protein [Candidatus Omnitrophota bacterium]
MDKPKIKAVISKLLQEIEEEDVGISLLTTHYQEVNELTFFKGKDREKVIRILRQLSEDSREHKKILERIIMLLGEIDDAE